MPIKMLIKMRVIVNTLEGGLEVRGIDLFRFKNGIKNNKAAIRGGVKTFKEF